MCLQLTNTTFFFYLLCFSNLITWHCVGIEAELQPVLNLKVYKWCFLTNYGVLLLVLQIIQSLYAWMCLVSWCSHQQQSVLIGSLVSVAFTQEFSHSKWSIIEPKPYHCFITPPNGLLSLSCFFLLFLKLWKFYSEGKQNLYIKA